MRAPCRSNFRLRAIAWVGAFFVVVATTKNITSCNDVRNSVRSFKHAHGSGVRAGVTSQGVGYYRQVQTSHRALRRMAGLVIFNLVFWVLVGACLALHRALRRMAGLVFRLFFWVLAGACQRHGVGGFL